MQVLILLLTTAILSLSIDSSEPDLTNRVNQDYALFFAVNEYDHLDKLNNSIKNARDIAWELERSYGFKTEVVENPSIDELDDKIAAYPRKFSSGTFSARGQLFIHFDCFLFFKPLREINFITITDRTAYKQALDKNTLSVHRQYQGEYPNGDFSRVVGQKSSLEEEGELLSWEEAKELNSPKAYDDFIRSHPSSMYVATAELEKENLLVSHDSLIFVKGGTFQMGSNNGNDDEKPIHSVTVPDFYIGKYEVTQKQWRDVMGSDPEELYNTGCDNCPVERVSWGDIQVFLTQLNQQTGKKYRLPSEAEWEYAARGGQQSKNYTYSGSNTIGEVAWYSGNVRNANTFGAKKTTRPVGMKQPNELGIYDMSGNVREWCEDDCHDDYTNAPKNGRAWVDSPRAYKCVYRGGCFSLPAVVCRVAFRGCQNPTSSSFYIGFRLAHSL